MNPFDPVPIHLPGAEPEMAEPDDIADLGSRSFFPATYYYETDSKPAADVFDEILDGVCFQANR